uniref:EGF-like domain-containing protein n=1 Tax=Solanum tuberosum TaxID=4113 RepID=M0ZGV9_SOLTU
MFLILGHSCSNLFLVFLVFTVTCFSSCWVLYGEQVQGGDGSHKSSTLSSFIYATTVLKPYEWRYISVDLPPWFSSVTIALESNIGVDLKRIGKVSTLPMICFREGSPPLPDVYNTSLTGLDHISNSSFGGSQDLQMVEKCYPMQKSVSLMLTNEQINRGHSYSFSGNITVEGCTNSAMLGKFCNQTISLLSCSDTYISPESGIANMTPCGGTEESCLDVAGSKVYSLDVVSIAEKIIITALNITFTQSQHSNGAINSSGHSLMCYVRHGTLPQPQLYDYSADINRSPLVIPLPRLGRWYIKILPANLSERTSAIQEMNTTICYSLEWQVLRCPADKAGLNCTTAKYTLQTFLKRTPYVAFESYYLPISGEVSSGSASFPLGPLLSNSSDGDYTWTFFLLDIPDGAAGGNIHVRVTSEAKISGEIYARYGGFPSLSNWDYFYSNSTSNSNGSMFFKLYDASDKFISFYIIYARGGTWSFGLRHPISNRHSSTVETTMSISLERCPEKCSSHGACKSVLDSSGLTFYSFCDCDRRNGGFDCSVEVVSSSGQMWQSISLIGSNAAALLPAYWALRHKAFAEWVLYTSSGISSGLYHACDLGTWCPLSYHVLQFMDFWLSFMAVVSTFVYLSTIDEVTKRAIHTVVAILTALMAESGPTKSSNIILVVAIGTLALFIGFLIEFFSHHRWISFSTEICLNMLNRWETVKAWIHNFIRSLLKRFRWGFLLAGFTALAMAAISWKLETSQNYWIWHSAWHVSIYTSSFLFLCSKATPVNCENEQPRSENYELARQNSFSGSNERGGR